MLNATIGVSHICDFITVPNKFPEGLMQRIHLQLNRVAKNAHHLSIS